MRCGGGAGGAGGLLLVSVADFLPMDGVSAGDPTVESLWKLMDDRGPLGLPVRW